MTATPDKRRHPVIGGLVVLGALSVMFVLGAILAKFLELQDTSPPELIGGLWNAKVDQDQTVYLLTEKVIHELRLTKFLPWEKTTFRRYTLQSRKSQDGSILAEEILGDRYSRGQPSEILGIAGNYLWLWNEQLEVRDLKTLELVADSETLRSTNASFGGVFPNSSKFFRVSARLDTLIFQSLDARYFIVSPQEWILRELVDENMKSTALDCRQDWTQHQTSNGIVECGKVWYGKAKSLFQIAESDGKSLWGTTYNDYLHQSLRDKEAWYALLSPEEKNKLSKSDIAHQSKPYWDVARMFYRVPYLHNAQRNELELNLDHIQTINQTRFIKGGLLKRRSVVERTEYTWRLNSPPSVMVLSKPTLEENSPWQITRMSLEGQVVWSVSTKLVILGEVLPGEQYLVLGGFENARGAQGRIPMRLITIDVIDGRLRMSTVEPSQDP